MKKAIVLLIILWSVLDVSAQLTVSVNVTHVTCYGLSNGSASATVSGGSGNYLYQWDDSSMQTTAAATGLAAGEYHLYVADTAGGDTTIEVSVQQPNPLALSATVSSSMCNGAIGLIVLQVTGGSQPYQYTWDHLPAPINSPVIYRLYSGTYHVVITDDHGCTKDTTVVVPEIMCEVTPELVFTPNGDGINDTWSINRMELIPDYFLTVFNRWGQKVFESEGNYEPWDGRNFGMELPEATYYYVLYQDKEHKGEHVQTGSVTIVR